MSETNTGGPAFPQHVAPAYRQEPEIWGMTLRDYFAAKAMQGFVEAAGMDVDFIGAAGDAYTMADAMLEARNE